jgi:hypothetical protein
MVYAQRFGQQPMGGSDHVIVAIVRKVAFQAVARLARSAAADAVRQNDEVAFGVERSARGKQS